MEKNGMKTNRLLWEAHRAASNIGLLKFPKALGSTAFDLALVKNSLFGKCSPLLDAKKSLAANVKDLDGLELGALTPEDRRRYREFEEAWEALLDKEVSWEPPVQILKDALVRLEGIEPNDLSALLSAGVLIITKKEEDAD